MEFSVLAMAWAMISALVMGTCCGRHSQGTRQLHARAHWSLVRAMLRRCSVRSRRMGQAWMQREAAARGGLAWRAPVALARARTFKVVSTSCFQVGLEALKLEGRLSEHALESHVAKSCAVLVWPE